MIGGVFMCVSVWSVRLLVLVDDGGSGVFGGTAENIRKTGAGFVPALVEPNDAYRDTHTYTGYVTLRWICRNKCTHMPLTLLKLSGAPFPIFVHRHMHQTLETCNHLR